MNVVAGKYRGKKLRSPKTDAVRPTTTRIKETIFNILQADISGATVLDLFAGSGALGIECISRGAAEVVFVDKSKDSIALVKSNLQGIEGNFSVFQADFSAALNKFVEEKRKFDIIFLDPPYASDMAETAIDIIRAKKLLATEGVIVYEHSSDKTFVLNDTAYKQRTKRMGTVTAEFIVKKSVALMTGSFDPVTRGHEEVLCEGLTAYDEVIVACLINPDKTYTFTPAQRLALASAMCAAHINSRAIFSDKMAYEVAAEVGADVIIRGVRDVVDEGYEKDMADFNREHGIDTRFIVLDDLKDISSTLVREQIKNGDYSNLPDCVKEIIISAEFANLK